MLTAKTKIGTCVTEYIRLFPDEYAQFCRQTAQARAEKLNRFATPEKGAMEFVERKLGEYPENLYNALDKMLTQDEKDWFWARGSFTKDFKGQYWFFKKYPMFAITEI